jgi:hypothetical protein
MAKKLSRPARIFKVLSKGDATLGEIVEKGGERKALPNPYASLLARLVKEGKVNRKENNDGIYVYTIKGVKERAPKDPAQPAAEPATIEVSTAPAPGQREDIEITDLYKEIDALGQKKAELVKKLDSAIKDLEAKKQALQKQA